MGLIFAPGWPNNARQREMVAGQGTPSVLELGTILGKVELAQDKKDRYSAEVGGGTRTAAQEDGSD